MAWRRRIYNHLHVDALSCPCKMDVFYGEIGWSCVGGASFGPPRHSSNEGFGENVCLVATDGETD